MSINRINSFRLFEVNSSIVEWDIRRAGINLIKTFDLLPDQKIDQLSQMEKREADRKIGIMQIDNQEFSKALENSFTEIMEDFLRENELDIDYDIIAIKKDACFVINKRITKQCFGEYIEFVPKHRYHAYIHLHPYEFYYSREEGLTLKNMTSDPSRRKEILSLHKNGVLNFLECVIQLAETTNMNRKKMNRFLHDFVTLYKRRELDFDYYRQFNVKSGYLYQTSNSTMLVDYINESMFEKVDISYNYQNIILPLINILC